MQRTILRTIAAMSVMCLCCIMPFQVFANASDYGPEMDPLISDKSENISLTCPPPMTVDCDENGIYMSYAEFEAAGGSVNLPDGCVVDSFTFVADIELSQNGCTFVYFREYFIAESCGNTFTCNQIILLTDDDNPVIVGVPADTTFEVTSVPCTVDFMVPDLSAMDGCSDATVTNNAPSDFPIGETVVVYTAMDQCGNESQDSFKVTVVNNSPIMVTCPSNIIDSTVCDISGVEAYVDFAAFVSAGGSATRACDSIGTTFTIESHNDVQIGGSCPKAVNRTYVISDGNGNVDSCTQMITIIDNDGPSFTVPADIIDLECSMLTDTSVTGVPVDIMDNCDSIFTVTFKDSLIMSGACMGEATFERTWTVTDQCNNETLAVQTISTIDTTPPNAMCKDTVFVYLDSIGDAIIVPDSLDNGSSDLCSDVTFSTTMSTASCNLVNSPTMVTLSVTDDCDNTSTCMVVLVVLDTINVVLTSPQNDTVQCIADIDPIFEDIDEFEIDGGGIVEDNCPAFSFTMIGADTSGTCPITVTRMYEYVELSGNSDTALHTILVIDTIPPDITSCPADISISQTDICDTLLVFGLPVVSDNCGDVTITNNYTNDTSSMAVFSGGVTEILFTIQDACGNQDTCSMTVTLDADPKIQCPTLGVINSADDLPDYPDLDAFLMAGGMINSFCNFVDSTFVYTNSFVLDVDSCTATINEMISISDTLGNQVVETKTTSIIDNLAPEITNCFDQFVALIHATCEVDTNFILPTVTDNFGVDSTYFTLGAFIDDTAQVVFYAEDFCGNVDSCEFELVLYDPTSPDIELDDITIMCDSMGAAPIFTTVTEFLTGPGALIYDCRVDSLSFAHLGDVVDVDGNIIRTYSIDDLAGNTGTTAQMITFDDTTDPEFTMCTADIAMDAESDTCGAMIMVPLPTYMDNCGEPLTLINDYNGTNSADGFYPIGTTTVVWTIEDSNGLMDTCSFTVSITDTTPPDIQCPGDTMIICDIDNYPPFGSITDFIAGGGQASDNCDLLGINANTVLTNTNIYTRTYTIVDENGLQDTCTQTIEVVDTIAPELICVPMIIESTDINSCDKFINIIAPTATDNCSGDIEITNSLTGSADPSGVYSDTTEISWYAEDDFGNIDTCTYNIIVVDGTGPIVSNPDTVEIMCDDMLTSVDTFMTVQDIVDAGGDASDNCGIEFINLMSQTNISIDSVLRLYSIVDSTGNSSTLMQLIVIDDTTPPTFEAPVDVTIACDDDPADLSLTGTVDSMLLADNCMDIDTLIYIDLVDPDVCPFVQEISRVWVLTDNGGNETRDTQIIMTIDTIAPDFDSLPGSLAAIDCDDNFPPQEMITATDNCTGATVFMDTLPFLQNICSGYEVTYRWIAEDGCQNRDTILRSFIVNPDDTPPALVDLNNITVDSEGDRCGISLDSVTGPLFEEDCSTITLTRNYSDTIYHVGTNNVSWTATNACNLDSTVTQVIIVEDNILPVVLCKDATAGLTADPQNYVFASSFVEVATDNCGIDSVLVRRLTAACGDLENNVFGDSIHICCEDIGLTIDVEIKIVDESGNENFCDATLEVDDERAPLVLEALPNIVISCSFVFDTLDLDVFGSFTSDPTAREEIRIEDILYESQDSIAGIDGLVSDECMVSITDSTIVNLGACNDGSITRIFTFTDLSGNTTTSQQIIQIQDVSPFNENGTDITWPADFTWNQCGVPAPDTSIAGSPTFENLDKCAQVSASYKDQLFNFPTTSCPKVKRKWQVIDWCQYDEDLVPNPGLWTYNQYIIVENDVPPTILSACTDTLICAPNNECSAIVNLGVEAEDDCGADSQYLKYSYTININSDSNTSNDISGQTSSFSLEIDNGIHEVTWVVEDRCGNETSCTYTLTVNECKAPTAVCLTGLVIVINEEGLAELWASDVNQSSNDNCTDEDDLIFSFSSDEDDFGVVFDCEDVGTSQYIEMWVTDLEGNQSFCSTFVDVQDNNGYCNEIIGNDDSSDLAGKIATETNTAIPEAMVSIFGAEMDEDYMTAEDGAYAFNGINIQNDYQVKVDRDKEDMDGVSSLDLVYIQRHILGLNLLTSPYKMIAADVNNSESISSADLLELRKMILGIYEAFPDNESWRFVSMNDEMDDISNPWPFSEDLIVGSAPLQEVEADFIGVKIGDVNNSVENVLGQDAITSRNDKSLGIVAKNQRVHRDDEVFVEFLSSTDATLEAMQMTIEWDKELMNFVDIIPIGLQMEESFINKTLVNQGIITIAWTSVEAKSIYEGSPIFQLVFEGNRTFDLSDHISISSRVTQAIAYDQNDVEYDIELGFVEGEIGGMKMFQNKPNPFAAETIVEFTLTEDMEVTFKLFNSAGSLIHKNTKRYSEGLNAFKLSEELKDNRGLLFLKMETAEFSDIKRMIRIE